MKTERHGHSDLSVWKYPALLMGILLVISLIFAVSDLDRKILTYVYSQNDGWYLSGLRPVVWLYKYGTIPGLLLSLGSLIGYCLCIARNRDKEWTRIFLVILLTSIVGGGLIVNAALKNYWGRPRPNQTEDFGGRWQYHPVYEPGIPGKGKSFPCGHCTMGYLFITFLYLRRKTPVIAGIGGVFGFVYGTAIGIGRVLQGAHFPTDVIWSFGIMLLVSMAAYRVVNTEKFAKLISLSGYSPRMRKLLWTAMGVLSIAICLAFATQRPYYDTYYQSFPLSPNIEELVVETNVEFDRTEVLYGNTHRGEMQLYAKGFGLPNVYHAVREKSFSLDGTYVISNRIETRGLFSELSHGISLYLPESLKGTVRVTFITIP